MSVLTDEQTECPLCMELLEVDDINFFPCTCGYQICRFCWHRIRTNENGLCPACRKPYSENPADFKPLSQEEVQRIKQEKKQKDLQRKQKNLESRKHLANVRVVQKNLVFVVGLSSKLADSEVLKKPEYFGKFGKIHKIVINHSTSYAGSQGPSASAYVTFHRAEDALRAIEAVNNIQVDGKTLKASLGTTKYCSHFMKNQPCPKQDCMYLHELGDEAASFTKEEMQQSKHQDYERKLHEELNNIKKSHPQQIPQLQQHTDRISSSPPVTVGTPPKPGSMAPPTTKEAWPSLNNVPNHRMDHKHNNYKSPVSNAYSKANSGGQQQGNTANKIRHTSEEDDRVKLKGKPNGILENGSSNVSNLISTPASSSPSSLSQTNSSDSDSLGVHFLATTPPQLDRQSVSPPSTLSQTPPAMQHHPRLPNRPIIFRSPEPPIVSSSSSVVDSLLVNDSSYLQRQLPFDQPNWQTESLSHIPSSTQPIIQNKPWNDPFRIDSLPNRFVAQSDRFSTRDRFNALDRFPTAVNRFPNADNFAVPPSENKYDNLDAHIGVNVSTTDDELGFDPIEVTQKAFAEIILKESQEQEQQKQQQIHNHLGNVHLPISNKIDNNLVFGENIPLRSRAPPPGFSAASNFGSLPRHQMAPDHHMPFAGLGNGLAANPQALSTAHLGGVATGRGNPVFTGLTSGLGLQNHIRQQPSNKDWQEELRSVFPNVNLPFSSGNNIGGFSGQTALPNNRFHQQNTSLWRNSCNDWTALDPAIVSSGQLSDSRTDSPPHWMKSLEQLTESGPIHPHMFSNLPPSWPHGPQTPPPGFVMRAPKHAELAENL